VPPPDERAAPGDRCRVFQRGPKRGRGVRRLAKPAQRAGGHARGRLQEPRGQADVRAHRVRLRGTKLGLDGKKSIQTHTCLTVLQTARCLEFLSLYLPEKKRLHMEQILLTRTNAEINAIKACLKTTQVN